MDNKIGKDLHEYYLEKTWVLTEEWYDSLDKSDPQGVYSSANPEVIKALKQQNYGFHVHFCDLFIKDEETHLKEFENWVIGVAKDDQHLSTPLNYILREFFRTQEQYLDLFDAYIFLHDDQYDRNTYDFWRRKIIRTFEGVILWFVEEQHKFATARLEAQQETIKELSSPVIPVGGKEALLPLIGQIDTARAKMILENTLTQCVQKGVNLLYLDLSGVVIIDTMVAQQIFQLIEALKLIGVKTVLSGIRPEIAQTAIQLGIDFNNVDIKRKLQLIKEK